jgi:fructose-1,6-bisphosphatase/inositol monophosphatase family enzyme
VAQGVLDAYLTVGRSTLYGWDYLAGLLVCREAGVATAERDGRDLIVRDASSRRPVVAASPALAAQLAQDETL